MTVENYNITGTVAPGFESVRDAFVKNFQDDLEWGASYTAYYNGQKVVDLAGGWADDAKTKPYTNKSVHVVHSSGKAIMAMSIAHAVSKGMLRYDQKIADVWPEFAEGGKENVLVKDLLEHAGGVGWLDKERMPHVTELADLDVVAKKIAGQPHNFGGKLVKSYHALTRGWYLNEILRRSMGTTHGDLLKAWTTKLGVDVFVGFPASEDARFCNIGYGPESAGSFTFFGTLPPQSPAYKSFHETQIQGAWGLPGASELLSNVKEIVRCQVPSVYTVTNSGGLAAFANVMAQGGSVDGLEIMDAATFEAAHVVEDRMDPVDASLGAPIITIVGGWAKNIPGTKVPNMRMDMTKMPPAPTVPQEYFGAGWEWQGWDGLGGSQIQWSRNRKAAIGYAPTRLGPGGGMTNDRVGRLNLAFVEAVDKLEKK
ncbi:beta-lactamase/transpeptidase-like protein [Gonapodya prolifera JEL478]|uniref:Beta-lactamase/transpeptidase-like protein n=1 Tax=Gonapodya prolifera (strain JEL478) TaxID=1344416 RepID=A0A139AW93_GONPJ|nr:beta-lactamase/transpeptidase-like protein [Gonapodya prolifera JEL478]|eukprot:KXS21011.1 beta-lactamase/transpeptidase-like protein [Gonapodya prolifera JEL478]